MSNGIDPRLFGLEPPGSVYAPPSVEVVTDDDEVDPSSLTGEGLRYHQNATKKAAIREGAKHKKGKKVEVAATPTPPPPAQTVTVAKPQLDPAQGYMNTTAQNVVKPIDILEQVRLMNGLRMVLMNEQVKTTILSLDCGDKVYDIFKSAVEQELLKMIGQNRGNQQAADALMIATASFQNTINNFASSLSSLNEVSQSLPHVAVLIQALLKRVGVS